VAGVMRAGQVILTLESLHPVTYFNLIHLVSFLGKAASNQLWRYLPLKQSTLIVAATSTKELIWLQTIIFELSYKLSQPNIIYSDNQSSINLSENPIQHHDRTKHIDLRFHFLREKVKNKIFKLEYTPTTRMWADLLPKSLPKDKHYAYL